jgi:hypothetical protein
MRFSVLALIVAMGTPVFAETERCSDGVSDKSPANFHVEYVGGKSVMVIPLIVVCGKLPHPGVAYVTAQKDISYVWETLKQDFMPFILASVKKAPF